MEEFYRIRRLPPYVFETVNRAKAAARNAGADIIDLGMGNPDLPAPQHVIDKLKETLGKPRTDRYSASKGIAGLRRAQAAYYARRFGVKLNPDTQIVATLGSKEGFANVAQAITAPGDVVLVPNPSYPIHAFGFLMAGGVIRSVPSEPTPEFFVALERAIIHSIPKPIAVVVCYPSNPTAYVADLDFYKDLVAFAKKHEPDRAVRSRLCRSLFRRQSAAVDAAGAGRDGRGGRVHLDVEDLFDAGLAHRLRGRQRAHHRRAGAREVLSRLRRVHAGAGGGDRRAQRPGRLHPRDARHLQAPPRRAGREFRPRRLGNPAADAPRCSPGRRCRSRSAPSAASNFPSCWSRRPRLRSRRASASASTAKASCASRWSRTSSASARPRATSAASLKPAPEKLHNVVPLAKRR